MHEETNDWHSIWFQLHVALDIAEEVGTEKPQIPHRCNRQTQWANVEADTLEVYYQRTLTIPFLDQLVKELKDRFSSNAKVATSGLCLVPSVTCKREYWQANVNDLGSLYQADLPALLSLTTELHCWNHKFLHSEPDKLPDAPVDALSECDIRLFPNVSTLLKILSTIPVTSCEAEKTFSALRRIKPLLRTTMTEDRLSGLTLLHIH